ncbi:MAG: hypothetical protein VYE22_37280 [Myxococcota bacterium]|nr:hypothetical protein [Myxococcota bacterium]
MIRWCAIALLLVGCDIYDIGPALAALDAGGGEPSLAVYDRCGPDPLEALTGGGGTVRLNLAELEDDERSLTGCDGRGLSGADAFVAIDAEPGDRWTVVAEPLDTQTDVVVYTMPLCDPGACTTLVDRCGPGILETFVFEPEEAGQHVLGFDSYRGGGELDLTVVQTTCGDRRREPGEGCDDGNEIDGDGCDSSCRLEISLDRLREIEPNNETSEANVAPTEMGEARSMVGRLGGACDVDVFAVRVTERASLSVIMLDGAELPCEEGTPEVTMTLLGERGLVRRGAGTLGRAGGACPSIEPGDAFAEGLDPGVYFVALSAARGVPTLDYHLALELTAE